MTGEKGKEGEWGLLMVEYRGEKVLQRAMHSEFIKTGLLM